MRTPPETTDQASPFDWRKHLKVHPAAELFPLMKDTDPAGFGNLVEDIVKARGRLICPIALWRQDENDDWQLLDGRNRLDALALAGMLGVNVHGNLCYAGHEDKDWSIYTAAHPGGDPFALALSFNVHRRHLTPDQKDDLIAAVLKAKTELSNRQIGVMTKTDKNKVGAVRTKLEATGEISPVEKTIGKDKKARKQPAKKPPKTAIAPKQLSAPKRAVATGPEKRTTHVDILGAWLTASPADRTKAIDGIGLDPLLATMPPAWLPLLEQRLAHRQHASKQNVATDLPADPPIWAPPPVAPTPPIEPLPPSPSPPPLPQPPVPELNIDELRKRAKRLGYKLGLRKHGTEFVLLDKNGRTKCGGDIGGLGHLLDVFEGKVAEQYTMPCGTPIEGMTNEPAIKARAKRCGFHLHNGANGFDLIKKGVVRGHAATLAEVVKLLDETEPVGGAA